MSAAHTPAPWAFVQGGSGDFPTWNVRLNDRGFIRLPATADMAVMDADARLIAAAPDLLQAAKDLKEVCNRPSAARTRAYAWKALDKAIAKAEGR